MNGILSYSAPRNNRLDIFGMASTCIGLTAALIPVTAMIINRLLEWELRSPGAGTDCGIIATIMLRAPLAAMLTMSTIGVALGAAGIIKGSAGQWLAPLGMAVNIAMLVAASLTAAGL